MADNRSKKVLATSLERRMKHVMVRMLGEFDRRFADTSDGNLFKVDFKHAMNDMIRATRDEINDYDIEYRPVRLNADNTLSMTKEFMESIECVSFVDDPVGFRIEADKTRAKVLEALRSELGVGATLLDDNGKAVYVVSGVRDCLRLLPFLDRYRLTPDVREQYVRWRSSLVYSYSRS